MSESRDLFTRSIAVGFSVALAGCSESAPSEVSVPTSAPDVVPTPSIDPTMVPKFAQPLSIPQVMPPSSTGTGVMEYRIRAAQFSQQVLPAPLPKTTVWGYGKDGDPLPDAGVASTY